MIPLLYLRLGAAAVALAVAAVGGWTLRGWRASGQIEALGADLARVKGEHAAAVALAASAALAQSETFRRSEAANSKRVQEANRARETELQAGRMARAAADSRIGELQHALSSYTCTAASGPAGDSSAAAGADAPTVWQLLGPILQGYRDATESAEAHAADVRALLRGWPQGVRP